MQKRKHQMRKHQTRNRFIVLNIIVLVLCGSILGNFWNYIERTEHLPRYITCTNSNASYHTDESSYIGANKEDEHFHGYEDVFHVDAEYAYPQGSIKVNNPGCDLQVNVAKAWLQEANMRIIGAQYDFTINNNSPQDIMDWTIQIKIHDGIKVDSFWNGEFDSENQLLTIKPLDYNNVIPSGESISFGCILHTPLAVMYIEECSILYYITECLIWHYPLFWVIIAILALVLVIDLAYGISAVRMRKFQKQREHDLRIIEESLRTFANIIDAKDCYTRGHSIRVAIYSRELAKRMKIAEDASQHLYYIALLHDIGKIGISDAILQKPSALTKEERSVIETHVTIGGEVLKDFTSIPGIAEGALYHHERFDGKGYPNGLKGEEIPLFARIIGVADSFDAMSSARCYRPKLEMDYILKELKEKSGSQFDPAVAKYMIEMIEEGVAPIEEDGDGICFHEH